MYSKTSLGVYACAPKFWPFRTFSYFHNRIPLLVFVLKQTTFIRSNLAERKKTFKIVFIRLFLLSEIINELQSGFDSNCVTIAL